MRILNLCPHVSSLQNLLLVSYADWTFWAVLLLNRAINPQISHLSLTIKLSCASYSLVLAGFDFLKHCQHYGYNATIAI